MCTGTEGMALAGGMQMGGTLLSGLSQYQYNSTQADLARADAKTEREAAQRQAELIMRRTRQVQGAARAATAVAALAAPCTWRVRRMISSACRCAASRSVFASARARSACVLLYWY